MPCGTCFETHTTFSRALACYGAATPSPLPEHGDPVSRPVSALRGRRLQAVVRDGSAPARRPGRPRVPAAAQRVKAANRARAYRQKRKQTQAAANDALLAQS
jgi:hypothetical protein